MPDSSLVEILKLCLSLEGQAVTCYRVLSESSENKNIQLFWKRMSNQEKQHQSYWSKLLELAESGQIRNIFDNPRQVKHELHEIQKQATDLIRHASRKLDVKSSFILAYRLEFYMMHPVFEALFHLMRSETQDASPEDDYQSHINGLIRALRKFCDVEPEMLLVADLIEVIWKRNRQIADQLADVRNLRNLVPICMYCKNIRNDKGFWGKVENYIEAHSSMQFSHGICPDCINKYFPEYGEDKT